MTEEGTATETLLGFEGEQIKTYASDGVPLFEEANHEKIDKVLEKFSGEGGQAKLVKAYMELESKQGKIVKPLDESSTDRDRGDRRKFIASLLNVPDTPDNYDLIDPESVPEGLTINDNVKNELKIAAHKHHVSPEGAQAMYELVNNTIIGMKEAHTESVVKATAETATRLKADLGPDTFVKRCELIKRLLESKTSSKEEWESFQKNMVTDNDLVGTNFLINKVLGEYAEQELGEGSTIYSQARERMQSKTSREQVFPNSPEMDE